MRSTTDRGSRRRVVVVSPHFDDVPLSLGQSLLDGALSRCEVRVHVAFARTNWTRWVHPTPRRARAVGLWRRAEESAAAARFGYRWRAGRWSESLLRTGELDPEVFLDADRDLSEDPIVDELAAWLAQLARPSRGPVPDLLLVSAGLGGHVDHRLLAAAAARLDGAAARLDGVAARVEGSPGTPIGFYEDRPYASYLDEEERARQLAVLGPDPEPVEVSGPVRASTQRWVRRCYPSQIDGYFTEAMRHDLAAAAPERVWFPAGRRPDWL